jgi:hypothetical protein
MGKREEQRSTGKVKRHNKEVRNGKEAGKKDEKEMARERN